MPDIPGLRRLKDLEFRTSLGYMVKLCLKKGCCCCKSSIFYLTSSFFNVSKDTNKNQRFPDSDKNSS